MLNLLLVRSRLVAGAALAVGLLIGCGGGSKTVTVTGKVIFPPKVKIAETDVISIVFVPEDAAKGKGASGDVNPKDLTFTLQVPPGKHKIGIGVTPYAGMKDSEKRTEILEQQLGDFASNKSSLYYEVTSDSTQSITVDLAKSTVTK